MSQHESTRVWHESNTSQHESNMSLTQVNTNQHKSKSALDELTWVNASPTRVSSELELIDV